MFFCRDCGKNFRDSFNLTKHQSRIKPCIPSMTTHKKEGTKNSALPPKNSALPPKNSALPPKNSALPHKDSVHNCVYCMSFFKSKWYKNNHEKECKNKNDPVRLLEIENNIDIEIPENKLECRFCNCVFARTDNLNKHIPVCKDRKEYLKNLQEYTMNNNNNNKSINQTINNNNNTTINNNNTTINNNNLNVNVNIFNGNEDKQNMDIDCIIDILKQCLKSCPEDQIRQIAFKIVCLYDKRLKELPENNTLRVPNLNSMIAYIKREIGWEMIPIDDGIHAVLTNSASDLMTHRKEIEDYGRTNKLTFKGTRIPMTPQIMDEIGYIKKNGIYTEQIPGSAKTAIKINNLEKII